MTGDGTPSGDQAHLQTAAGWSFHAQFPRPWLRACVVGAAASGLLWIATTVAWARPNGLLMVLVGVFWLPIAVALATNLDGMATIWGRSALAPFRIRAGNRDLDDDTRERVARVREEGAGRQAGAILAVIGLGWIVLGVAVIAGLPTNWHA